MRPVKQPRRALVFLATVVVVLLGLPSAAWAGGGREGLRSKGAPSAARTRTGTGGVASGATIIGRARPEHAPVASAQRSAHSAGTHARGSSGGVTIWPTASGGAAARLESPVSSHARRGQGRGSAGPGPSPPAVTPIATATTQTIRQLQISGCIVRCRRVSRLQFAAQHNTTMKFASKHKTTVRRRAGRRSAVTGGAAVATRDDLLIVRGIVQIQLGCLLHCFGRTTRTPNVGGIQQVLTRVLAGRGRCASPARDAWPGAERIIFRIARKWRRSDRWRGGRSRHASEATTTAEGLVSSLLAEFVSALGRSEPRTTRAGSRTVQRIWQIQLGCLVLCTETRQRQRAEQFNETLPARLPRSGAPGESTASATGLADQRIWQLQIGCLFWCDDAVEQQYAVTQNGVSTAMSPSAPAAHRASRPRALIPGPTSG